MKNGIGFTLLIVIVSLILIGCGDTPPLSDQFSNIGSSEDSSSSDEQISSSEPESSSVAVSSSSYNESSASSTASSSSQAMSSSSLLSSSEISSNEEPSSSSKGVASGTISVMTLNLWAHSVMPGAADAYATLINAQDVDIVGIQEGVRDWLIGPGWPTDYTPANQLFAKLGACWEQEYQIFINTCKNNQFVDKKRFDLTDGPRATRTGESALISKDGFEYAFINVHWDHEDGNANFANSNETAIEVNTYGDTPVIVLGDFNPPGCQQTSTNNLADKASMSFITGTGIDCIYGKGFSGDGYTVGGQSAENPSDHPTIIATVSTN